MDFLTMTNKEILRVAIRQSAVDMSCSPDDFSASENVVVESRPSEGARKYLELPFACELVSYGGNIVAAVSGEFSGYVREYIANMSPESAFTPPEIFRFNELLKEYGLSVKRVNEYFLPDLSKLRRMPCNYTLKLLAPPDFRTLYLPEWSNALCKKRKHLDMIAVGAYDGEKLAGLAGASADCETIWQIGVDVLPEYRRRGIAAALTSALTLELMRMGKIPFYCADSSNVKSVKTAVQCGYVPTWLEMTVDKIGKR